MKHRLTLLIVLALVLAILSARGLFTPAAQAYALTGFRAAEGDPDAAQSSAQGSGFTYQGQLQLSGSLVTNTCDFQFGLWNALSGGTQLGSTQTATGTSVSAGQFSAIVNFGAGYFVGDARWLELAVRCPSGSGSYTTLSPRQPLGSAPGALYAQTSGTALRKGFAINTLDSSITVAGNSISLAIGVDGQPLVAYADSTNGNLRVAHCSDTVCSAATLTDIDTTNNVGYHTAIAIGADGLALIAYYDATNTALRVAHCTNVACTAATTAQVDASGNNEDASVALGSDGLGLISYQATSAGSSVLRAAHCDNTACSTVTVSTIDSANPTGYDPSVTIGGDGLGLISYYTANAYDLMVAHCSNLTCTSATTTLAASDSRVEATSIAIGVDGMGLISFWNSNAFQLRLYHCSNTACTTGDGWLNLDATPSVGADPAIVIGTDGLGGISYYDSTNNNLKFAHCSNVACTTALLTTVDSSANSVGTDNALVIGTDGLPLIAYYDATSATVKVAHLSDIAGQPYVRRR